MPHPRFEFALTLLRAEHWRPFERLCSEYLVSEFPDLRTTASASGDRGRDGEVFTLDNDPKTAFQFSVTPDWKPKIAATVTRLKSTFPTVNRLVYCSPHEIGALADDLKQTLWAEEFLLLDVRDRGWFVERSATTTERATAAEELAVSVADPLLRERRLVEVVATPLTPEQNRVAMVQLAMNAQDRATERGLTKTSFDALVKAALIDTSAENTRSLEEVQDAVCAFLPGAGTRQVRDLTHSALNRLSARRGPVKHRTDSGRYHLSFEESQAWRASAAEYLLDQDEVEADLAAGAYGLEERLDSDYELLKKESRVLRTALESVLMQRGEAFVRSVRGDEGATSHLEDLAAMVADLQLPLSLSAVQAAQAITNVLEEPSDRTQNHLARVLDAYTLFAFLQQTPDVQKTLSKIFSGGEIWLDTSAILPLLSETLVADPERRVFTGLLSAARESGIKLFATAGVIEEVVAHLDHALLYIRMTREWESRIPFIYTAYIMSGRAEESFSAWVADFKGDEDPAVDIEEYLRHYFGIRRKDLLDLADGADPALRGAVQDLWEERHMQRRGRKGAAAPSTGRLISHDVENVVGVIQHRRRASDSPLGYTAWWLTLDGTAFGLASWLKDRLGSAAPASPVLSPDYLSQIMRLGPLRRQSADGSLTLLPLSVNIRVFEKVPPELIALAKSTREQYAEFDELRIRREVRDALNRARRSAHGEREYSASLETEILNAISE